MANKGFKDFNGATVLMRFCVQQGYSVRYTGLCVWAKGQDRRKGSKADRLMREAGFSWSQKKQAYYVRAAQGASGLPSAKEFYKAMGASEREYRAKAFFTFDDKAAA